MSNTRILVIGAVACGAKAASRIRRLNPCAEITMIDQGKYISYAGCGLPYHISGKVRDIEDLVRTTYGKIRDSEYFMDLKGIRVLTGTRAESIDRESRIVTINHIETGMTETLEYDRLVLATGASPAPIPVEGADLEGIYNLTTMEDAAAIAELVRDNPGGKAVIIGGGFIGVEAAEALGMKRWEVTMLERCDQLFPGALDFEIAAMIQEHLFEHMIEPDFNTDVVRFTGESGRVTGVVTDRKEYPADLVIIAAGVRPNTGIAVDAGLKTGETGALIVNERMQTSDPDIYAGGDLVENTHIVTGKSCYVPLGSTANKHGRVIADNICGIESRFPGIQATFVCKVFDYAVGSTGLTEKQAVDQGLDAWAVSAPGFDKAHYYPDSQIVALKLIIENGTDRLLGLQAVGKGDVARRIDVAATAIRMGATIDSLADLDLAYAPPFSQALDVFITLINVAKNRRAQMFIPVTALETKRMLMEDDDVILLDVRSKIEYRRAHIDDPKVLNIPLDELNSRMSEIPGDKKILCACLLGLRGFTAQRILQGAGFKDVYTIEGGMFLWPWKEELE